MTDIKVFKGNQVGGNVTVITTDQARIVIDYGEDLPGNTHVENFSIDWDRENVDAVFFTHYHADHIGRFMEIPESVPLYMGECTRRVLLNNYTALRMKEHVKRIDSGKNIHTFEEKKGVVIKDTVVTPYHVDHSAFDSYMFFVEAPGKTILHTGDYRDHGYRGHKVINGTDIDIMTDTIENEIKLKGRRQVDVLITEGTLAGSDPGRAVYTEKDMQNELTELFRERKHVFLKISSTNADSLLSFYRAARANGMGFYAARHVLDQMKVFNEMSRSSDLVYDFSSSWPVLRRNDSADTSEKYRRSFAGQRQHMRKEGFVTVVSEYDEDLFEEFSDLEPVLIFSMWEGYINKEIGGDAYNERLADFCSRHNAMRIRTGGHAHPRFIAKVIECVDPVEAVIPMHTSDPAAFLTLDIPDDLKKKIVLEK